MDRIRKELQTGQSCWTVAKPTAALEIAGFCIPTQSQWECVIDTPPDKLKETWSNRWNDHAKYSSAEYFGEHLMMPATGLPLY